MAPQNSGFMIRPSSRYTLAHIAYRRLSLTRSRKLIAASLAMQVPHLHLHCFVLPHYPFWMALQFIVTRTGSLGFVTVEQVLSRLQRQALE